MNRRSWQLAIWWALTALLITTFAVATVARFQELREPCADDPESADCGTYILTPEQAETLEDLGVSLDVYAAFQIAIEMLPALAYLTLGILIVRKQSNDRTALEMAFGIVAIGLMIIPEIPSALERGSTGMFVLVAAAWIVAIPAFVFVNATFPNGRFEPHWVFWAGALMSLGLTGEILVFGFLEQEGYALAETVIVTSTILLWLVIIAGQIYRYRRLYSQTERQQIKWVLFGIASLGIGGVVWTVLFDDPGIASDNTQLWLYLTVLPLLLTVSLALPATIAIAIFRHRLYDIDIILNRALVYTALTLGLGATYVILVVGGGSLLRALTGESTQLVVAISTLLIAALFRPLRNLLQSFVDRRFYRSRYNTRQTLEDFGVATREAIDLTELTGELTMRISATMQPEHISVWMRREPERNSRDSGVPLS